LGFNAISRLHWWRKRWWWIEYSELILLENKLDHWSILGIVSKFFSIFVWVFWAFYAEFSPQ
jgi:hypothetical protein